MALDKDGHLAPKFFNHGILLQKNYIYYRKMTVILHGPFQWTPNMVTVQVSQCYYQMRPSELIRDEITMVT